MLYVPYRRGVQLSGMVWGASGASAQCLVALSVLVCWTGLLLCTIWLSPHLLSLSFAPSLCCMSAGIFHHMVPSVSSQQSGANHPGPGALSSQQRHLDTNPKAGASFLASGPLQLSRTQTVLHATSPPTLALPPPPPLLNASSAAPSQPSSPHLERHQSSRPQSSLPASTSSPSLAATSASSASSRPFTVHYPPHLPPPHPPGSAGSGGALMSWRTLGMQASYTASQIPGNSPR